MSDKNNFASKVTPRSSESGESRVPSPWSSGNAAARLRSVPSDEKPTVLRYTRDQILSLYRPSALPVAGNLESSTVVVSQESLPPVSHSSNLADTYVQWKKDLDSLPKPHETGDRQASLGHFREGMARSGPRHSNRVHHAPGEDFEHSKLPGYTSHGYGFKQQYQRNRDFSANSHEDMHSLHPNPRGPTKTAAPPMEEGFSTIGHTTMAPAAPPAPTPPLPSTSTTVLTPAVTSVPTAPPSTLTIEAMEWYYVAPNKETHGPYPSSSMREWFQGKFFPSDVPISLTRGGPFYPLSAYFPDLSMAFAVTPAVPAASVAVDPSQAGVGVPPNAGNNMGFNLMNSLMNNMGAMNMNMNMGMGMGMNLNMMNALFNNMMASMSANGNTNPAAVMSLLSNMPNVSPAMFQQFLMQMQGANNSGAGNTPSNPNINGSSGNNNANANSGNDFLFRMN